MAEPNREQNATDRPTNRRAGVGGLQLRAVAIDPPRAGAVGIQELLSRFEGFAETGDLLESPQSGAVGIRELLARLANLAEAGYFSSPEPEPSDGK